MVGSIKAPKGKELANADAVDADIKESTSGRGIPLKELLGKTAHMPLDDSQKSQVIVAK